MNQAMSSMAVGRQGIEATFQMMFMDKTRGKTLMEGPSSYWVVLKDKLFDLDQQVSACKQYDNKFNKAVLTAVCLIDSCMLVNTRGAGWLCLCIAGISSEQVSDPGE